MQRYPKEIEDKAIATSLEHENCLLRIKIIKLEYALKVAADALAKVANGC
jgi:hypothetical protein